MKAQLICLTLLFYSLPQFSWSQEPGAIKMQEIGGVQEKKTEIAVEIKTATDTASKKERKHVLKTAPFLPFGSIFQVAYERFFNQRKSSLFISTGVLLKDGRGEYKGGVNGMIQYRFYTLENKNITSGYFDLFAAPYFHYKYAEISSGNFIIEFDGSQITQKQTDLISSYEGGFIGGLQAGITSRIVIDIYFGGGVRYSDSSTNNPFGRNNRYYNNVFSIGYTGIVPKFGFHAGVLF